MGNQGLGTKNSHIIKKRHKKKYFRKLGTIKLAITVYNLTSCKMVFANRAALDDFGIDKFPESGEIDGTAVAQPNQKYFNCPTGKAISRLAVQVKNSEDGTIQFGWDLKTVKGEAFSVWVTITKIQIGNELYAQCIHQKTDDEDVQPKTVNESYVKVKITDDSSELTTTQTNLTETKSIQDNQQSQLNSSSVQVITSLEDFSNEDLTESIIDEIKKKIRSYDDFETENFITNKLNLLNSTIEEQKNYYQNKISDLLKSSSKQKSEQKNKYLELEKLYGKRLKSFNKEKKANKELNEEVKQLKKRISRIKKQLKDL
ncbi:a-type inclusion protein [Anaeramoeba flamelloides]|uniref:A-type inclusion protein n=1 Tax=Anaeramoeba flamelloides TaxID=1746091 RepID=A0ABQ8YH99_9EUKA|nr:a-type inclusion protein [Anaeramoeba flamelloides]